MDALHDRMTPIDEDYNPQYENVVDALNKICSAIHVLELYSAQLDPNPVNDEYRMDAARIKRNLEIQRDALIQLARDENENPMPYRAMEIEF